METSMEKVAELQFIGDLLNQGFTVKLTVSISGRQLVAVAGTLPPESELADCLQTWHQHYRQMGDDSWRTVSKADVKGFGNWRIKPKTIDRVGSIQRRRDACNQSAQQLRDRFLAWLETPSFQPIGKRLRDVVPQDEPVQLLLRADDQRIEELPWHQWDFLAHRDRATYSFTPHRYVAPPVLNSCARLRVLVLLGQSDGLNTQADAALFDRLPDGVSEVICFPQRSSKDLMDKLWEQPWDVIVFAGHSRTVDGVVYIEINDTESLTITELWYALKQAVNQGLQLVIFNSCDGMGLSHKLDDELSIPHLIVMRELVPDRVANAFLDYLLTALAAGLLLPHAVEQARQRLQSLEPEFPCATWLPILWQNPAATPFHLPTPPSLPPTPATPLPWRRVLATSLAVTCLVMGIRWLGWLQSAELAAFDRFMQPHNQPYPLEKPDPRILLVELTEADIRDNAKYGFSVSDGVLAALLEKLQRHKPRVIGLHIFRDIPLQPGHEALVKHLKTDENLVTICGFGEEGKNEIPPPDSPSGQVSFNNFILDSNNWVRRYLFYRAPNGDEGFSPCTSQYSFAFQLAFQYLNADKVVFHQDERTNYWHVGDRILQKLQLRSAAYQAIDNRGNQIMINYRQSHSIARSISLTEVMAGNYDPAWITNKIVMIGVTAPTLGKSYRTPVGMMPDLHLHAHVVSQIISAVKDNRSLIWWFPQWVDALLVFGVALIGAGMSGWWRSSPLALGIGITASSVLLYLLYHALFGQSGLWLPLLPTLLAIPLAALGFSLSPALKAQFFQQQSIFLRKESP